jgi:hypothetical protein
MDVQSNISSMIDSILSGDNLAAKDTFASIISSKLTDALDAKKLEVAQGVYSDTQEVEQDTEQDETDDNNAVDTSQESE